jgi:hypothetical protein
MLSLDYVESNEELTVRSFMDMGPSLLHGHAHMSQVALELSS